MLFSYLLVTLAIVGHAIGTPLESGSKSICRGTEVLISEEFIGEFKNVKMQQFSCLGGEAASASLEGRSQLHNRQANSTNVCGANCVTNCFVPAGGGPDPNECHIIADALRFESQHTGPLFQIGTGSNNTIAMTFRSCLTFFVNQDFNSLVYCRLDWASLIDFVAPNCQSAQNAHGGNCVANNQMWFVQVQHS